MPMPLGRIFVGTCSWTDRSLIECGRFYPAWCRSAEDRLRFYASRFPIVEVDSTYYALPSQAAAKLWVERTSEAFLFHIKAFRLFTLHWAEPSALPQELRGLLPVSLVQKGRFYLRDLPGQLVDALWQRFVEALLPLDSAGKLGLVLFQFPKWVVPSAEVNQHVLDCQQRLGSYRMAVEFRNRAWADRCLERTLSFLRQHRLTFVCVDEPQGFASSIPPLAEATTELAYVRFHGRNREMWEARHATSVTRFDYLYGDGELLEWVPRIRALQERTQEVHLLFNINREDQGPANAASLSRLLGLGAQASGQGALPL